MKQQNTQDEAIDQHKLSQQPFNIKETWNEARKNTTISGKGFFHDLVADPGGILYALAILFVGNTVIDAANLFRPDQDDKIPRLPNNPQPEQSGANTSRPAISEASENKTRPTISKAIVAEQTPPVAESPSITRQKSGRFM